MALVLALLGALVYGSADFAGGLASRRAPAIAVVRRGQLASVAVVAVLLVTTPVRSDAASLARGAAAGVTGGLALPLFSRGLARGAMTSVAPVTAVVPAIVPAAAELLLGDRPSALALVGVVLAARSGLLSITGVVLALHPASTVLLALVVLRERLAALRIGGFALAAGGVALIALG